MVAACTHDMSPLCLRSCYTAVQFMSLCHLNSATDHTMLADSLRRDKLAVVTQLLVPLLLVYIALWVSDLSVRTESVPPLVIGRQSCLLGAPALLAATPKVRNGTEFEAFMDAYPR